MEERNKPDEMGVYRAAAWLRGMRKERELTLEEAGKLTGIPFRMLSDMERGQITSPSAKTIALISRGYHVPVDEVMKKFGYEVYQPAK